MAHNFKFLIFLIFLTALPQTQALAQKAPGFTLAGDKGKVSLSSFKNKVVYVDFWASWCKPCRKSFPFMNEMQARYGKQGLEVVGINLDSDTSAAAQFLAKRPANFTLAYDPEGKTPQTYGLKVMPTSFLVDRRGQLVYVHKGFKENQQEEIEKLIVATLNRK